MTVPLAALCADFCSIIKLNASVCYPPVGSIRMDRCPPAPQECGRLVVVLGVAGVAHMLSDKERALLV